MTPRYLSFVVFKKEDCPPDVYEKNYKDIFEGKAFVFLGEVPQCPGHCILADLTTGKVLGMWHTEDFREANENEY